MDDYIIKGELGKGAYAVVRLGIHKPSKTKVAIKIYDKFKLRDQVKKSAVKREIQVLKRINHGNIVKLFEVVENAKNIYLVTEYFQGTSLLQFIKSKPNKKIKETDLAFILKQLTCTIAYLHNNFICHRDLKLENILINKELKIMLIDFGFGCYNPDDKKSSFFCGTPSYMPPEIISKREYNAFSADIWSLGILMYVLAAGRFPFRASNEKELYQKIKIGDFGFPDGISKEVKLLVTKSLNLNPSRRLSADDVAF